MTIENASSPFSNSTLQEIKETSNDLLDLMKNLSKRSLGDTQKKILISKHINHITYLFNQIVNDFTIPIEKKADCIIQSLPFLMESFNFLPSTPDYQEQWYQLSSAVNFFLLILVYLRGKLDQRRIQGTANLLATLLLGLPKIEQIPELPPLTDPHFKQSFAIFYNSLQSTAGVYVSIASHLETIKKSDLINWANLAFWHYKLHAKVIKEYSPVKLFETLSQQPNLYNSIISLVTPRLALLEFVFYLQKLFGDEWPPELDSHGLLKEHSFKGVHDLFKEIHHEIISILDILQDAHKHGLIDKNDPPEANQYVQILQFTNEQTSRQMKVFEGITTLLLDKTVPPQVLQETLQESTNILSMFSNFAQQNLALLFQSQFGEFFITQLEYHFGILALISKHESYEAFTAQYQLIRPYLEQIPMDSYPKIVLIKNLMLLHVYSTHPEIVSEPMLHEILHELQAITPYLPLFPRDLLATRVLIILLQYILGISSVTDLEHALNETEELCIINGYQFHLEEPFKLYKEALLIAFKNENPSYDFIHDRFKIYPLDVYSWLIPDINRLQTKTQTSLFYIPFNLKHDTIID